MPLVKCPFGCIANVGAKILLLEHVTCPRCHRTSANSSFADATGSESVSTSDQALTAQKSNTTVTQEDIDKSVMARIEKLMGLESKWHTRESTRLGKIKTIYNQLIQAMMTAELTTNFPTKSLHYILKSQAILNMWDLSPNLKDAYTKERDDTERDAFGQLNAQIRNSNLNNVRAQDRPGYLVLNVGNFIAGGAPNYGQSYVVYKDAVKLRCTYTASDTIQIRRKSPINHLDVVSFGHLSRLFLRMTDQNLKFLCQIVTGQLPTFRVIEFIEAQGWGKLDVRSDVAALVISNSDMTAWKRYRKGDSFLPDPIKDTEPGTARTQWVDKLRLDLQQFCSRYSIQLQFIETSPTTMASLDKRPGAA